MTDPALNHALNELERKLFAESSGDHWEGRLAGSALATAVASFALDRLHRAEDRRIVANALRWLANHQNHDGGWGDTPRSPSNLTATLLGAAALTVAENDQGGGDAASESRGWLAKNVGAGEGDALARAVLKRYGVDETFSAPILSMAAAAGLLGEEKDHPWRRVPRLPFELAALPHALYKFCDLHVVSYAIPALVAIGALRHHKSPPANPVARLVRDLLKPRVLRVLRAKQPPHGGFLDAAPLTGFVLMSLAEIGLADHPMALKCAEFLRGGQRADGSWPIDSNLSVWVTSLAIKALTTEDDESALTEKDWKAAARDWLLARRTIGVHPYTRAASGGWPWTHLPGGVPDADDTAAALLALKKLEALGSETEGAVAAGFHWLCELRNRDGGVPTFCRGWGTLPFDRSCPDITAHAIAAMLTWIDDVENKLRRRTTAAIRGMADYLIRAQRPHGAWLPLWFGNQSAPGGENPVLGTARVVALLNDAEFAAKCADHPLNAALSKGVDWLIAVQDSSGGWGGDGGVQPTIEETALAVSALISSRRDDVLTAAERGVEWLIGAIAAHGVDALPAAPIGLYFASLWYDEALYPIIFAVEALKRWRNVATRRRGRSTGYSRQSANSARNADKAPRRSQQNSALPESMRNRPDKAKFSAIFRHVTPLSR